MNDEGIGAAATAITTTEAAFENVPSEHEGAGATFTFGLMFSEEPDVGYQTLRDHPFEVTGGSVRAAKRRTQGSNEAWNITAAPASLAGWIETHWDQIRRVSPFGSPKCGG